MSQWVKESVAKSNYLRSMPGTHKVEKKITGSQKLYSDLHKKAVTSTATPSLQHTQTFKKERGWV